MTSLARGSLRLIAEDAPNDGVRNMALDRAILLERAAGRSPATLRLYRWSRPTVTLGRFQPLDSVDLEACRDEGIDVVRRFTGGRGVLHDAEVTYSVVAGIEDGVPRGTAASYRYLCAALVEAYALLGVDAGLTHRPRGPRSSGACYLHATHADVSAGTLKLSGSAQVWHKDTVLQHGSFVFARDVEREARVFRLSPEEAEALRTRTATLADLAERVPSSENITEAVRVAFERLFGGTFAPGTPSLVEEAYAQAIADSGLIAVPLGHHSRSISLE